MVRLSDRPDMTLDVYLGRKTTTQHNNNNRIHSQSAGVICCKQELSLNFFLKECKIKNQPVADQLCDNTYVTSLNLTADLSQILFRFPKLIRLVKQNIFKGKI